MKEINWKKLILSLSSSYSAAVIGSVFTYESIPTWYETLTKPFFTPPNWVFGPVWTCLYFFIGLGIYFVWKNDTKSLRHRNVYTLYIIQLLLNALWSIVFFGIKNPELAVIIIVGLWGSIFFLLKKFHAISPISFWLYIPYLLWVTYASLLNISIAFLNP